jgi:hypothetical protein
MSIVSCQVHGNPNRLAGQSKPDTPTLFSNLKKKKKKRKNTKIWNGSTLKAREMLRHPPGFHCHPTHPMWHYYFFFFCVLNPKRPKRVGRGKFFHFPSQRVSLSLSLLWPVVRPSPVSSPPARISLTRSSPAACSCLRQRILLLRQRVCVSCLRRYSTSWYSLSLCGRNPSRHKISLDGIFSAGSRRKHCFSRRKHCFSRRIGPEILSLSLNGSRWSSLSLTRESFSLSPDLSRRRYF